MGILGVVLEGAYHSGSWGTASKISPSDPCLLAFMLLYDDTFPLSVCVCTYDSILSNKIWQIQWDLSFMVLWLLSHQWTLSWLW